MTLQRLTDRCSPLWNMYGPTETTIWTTAHRVEAEDKSISIGRPIHNTQIYVLDSSLQPVPIGIPGELCIGGVGVARGYLHLPELTSEKLVPIRLAASPGPVYTKLVILPGICRTEAWTWLAASIIRSRFAASALNPERSNPP